MPLSSVLSSLRHAGTAKIDSKQLLHATGSWSLDREERPVPRKPKETQPIVSIVDHKGSESSRIGGTWESQGSSLRQKRWWSNNELTRLGEP